MSVQPNFFEGQKAKAVELDRVLLYALGDFQSRGKILANRELALDRLRGAFKRAAEKFDVEELTDEEIVKGLERFGAKIVKVPSFVAKHPFRVTIKNDLAASAVEFYRESVIND
jgi:histone H3/H4